MLLNRRRILMKVTFCLFIAVCVFQCWRISYHVQMTSPPSYRILEYEKFQESAMVMSNASSPTNIFSTTQSSDKLKHHKTTLITTTSCGRPYFLLVVVSSAPYNAQRRRDIRLTWGVDSDLNSRWKTVFKVAQTRNRMESEELLQDGETFGDLIRADYYDDSSLYGPFRSRPIRAQQKFSRPIRIEHLGQVTPLTSQCPYLVMKNHVTPWDKEHTHS